MTAHQAPDTAAARDAAAREAWSDAYALLRPLDAEGDGPGLTADDLATLADAAWWTGRFEESFTARRRAYAAYAAAGDRRRAGRAAWMLFYDHRDAGRPSTAAGWLRRARQHLESEPQCAEQCYLAWIEAEDAQQRGEPDAALTAAHRMTRIARACDHPDLLAMSFQVRGGLLLDQGRTAEGLALLDDAMCAVTAGELGPLFTGWIYCLALTRCMAAADLGRAAEWTESAIRWCAERTAANPFRGLCRVHQVEVLDLRGDWSRAETEAARVPHELPPGDAQVAAEAAYVTAEIRRRRGELAEAETAYARAHELGRTPQPGLGLLKLAQGKAEAAVTALRLALAEAGEPAGPDRLSRARLLAAQVEVELAVGNVAEAAAAADALEELARADPTGSGATLLGATAATARGAVALADHGTNAGGGGDGMERVLRLLRQALDLWLELRVPYEAAQVRMMLAAADRAAGHDDGARLELRAALAVFERLGSAPDARRAAALLGGDGRLPAGLTRREGEVLRLVAAGRTNREVASALSLSEHTVSRHLNNIFAKLQVSSRAAATAYAYRHDLA